ncbi:hypothetical protein PG994_005627 [Apiospora phragmitis]|uniref:GST N-terminal domain-containing protein n=1 Tax=Apiospora phragmitis TaxID=2905665 RepID=A0ABR1VCR6_9PEZI
MASANTSSADPIVFYDIASGPPIRPFAPNPWKTRYALNFKRAHFVTQWVDLADVMSTRKGLGADPVRFHANGEPFYTLPVIRDPGAADDDAVVVADSFDIAVYLEKKHPEAPPLFRPASPVVGLYAAFNTHMDSVFQTGAALGSQDLPFNPATAERCQAEFCRRLGVQTYDELIVRGEARKNFLVTLQTALGDVAKYFRFSDGPFIGGKEADYADIIIGGWLMMYSHTVPEWEEIRTWNDGIWGKLHDALEPYRGTW